MSWWRKLFGGGDSDQKIQIGKTVRTTAVAAGMAVSPVAMTQAVPGSTPVHPSVAAAPSSTVSTSTGATTINATINVYGTQGQDEDVIVQKVMAELANLQAQAQRGALLD